MSNNTPEREALAEEVKRLAGRYATHHRETYRHISSSSLPWVSLCAAIDALAASPAAGGVQALTDEQQQLMKFYGAGSLAELIGAQAKHIERLQAKLPPSPSLAPQRVREG